MTVDLRVPLGKGIFERLLQVSDVFIDNNVRETTDKLGITYDALMALGEDDILVLDGGDIACWGEIAINAWALEGRKIKGIFGPGPWEQMGTGPAFATAIQMASPGSKVVLITGDGSLGLAPGLTPMETAIDRDVNVTMIVANNAQWGMIQEQQRSMYGRIYATSLRDVDYHKIFAAAGHLDRNRQRHGF